MKTKYFILILILGAAIVSCKPELEEFNYNSGSVDFSNYVALGNSLTSGYADGALYKESQETSFPSILAGQLTNFGVGSFAQPLMASDNGVGLTVTAQGPVLRTKTILGFATDCLGATSLAPVPAVPNPDQLQLLQELSTPPSNPGPYNNLGVPGAKSFHLLAPGYGDPNGVLQGTANPYFARFASSAQASVISDAVGQAPTFFTLWIGSNDVLGYATEGGAADSITSPSTYAFYLSAILETLAGTGTKGAIGNIPDISSIPFFTTVPPNSYVLDQEQADLLNQFLGSLGFQYQAGPNYFITEDPGSQLGFRQMVKGELVLLTVPQDSLKCAFWGGFNPELQAPVPIPDKYVLDLEEIAEINAAINGYNQTISSLAATYDLAVVDIREVLHMGEDGIVYQGDTFTTEFITGNAFSLDGIHMTPKGNALVANTFIEAINAKYGSNIPLVSTTNYRANILP
jgi:hypothetical protein